MVNTNDRGGPKHRRRRRKTLNEDAEDTSSANDTDAARNAVVMDPKCKKKTTKEDDLSFAERRKLQRNAAVEKRRLKMKVLWFPPLHSLVCPADRQTYVFVPMTKKIKILNII